ncbi:MAG: hypothetical protein AAFY28_21200 [Actinomycetota bacterium]
MGGGTEIGNYATNSGNIIDSFFLDGGQGDVGLNIVESVLNGVNISIVHQSGENSLSDSANNMAGPVTGNNPTNEHSPSFSGNDISAPVSVSGTVDSANAIGGHDAASATPAPSSSDTLVAVAPPTVTMNGLWTTATDEPTNEEPTAAGDEPSDPPALAQRPAAVDVASDDGSDESSSTTDMATADHNSDIGPPAVPVPAGVESHDPPTAGVDEGADAPGNQ